MKILASLALAGACLAVSPAFAGPQGTGLTFTEEVAKKNLEKKRAAEAQASADCAPKTGDAAKADGASPQTCRAS